MEVPLGIKAVVAAIYEPPQNDAKDGVEFLEDPNEDNLNKLCGWLGLKKVGWIFTDLWSADASKGSVHCTRHKVMLCAYSFQCVCLGFIFLKCRRMHNSWAFTIKA